MTASRPPLSRPDCLICGETDTRTLTLEHIIPQALWRRFGVDPNQTGDVRKTHTTLCERCNGATSRIHSRPEMLDLIEAGKPVTPAASEQMADWVFWVLLLLGLEQGDNIVPDHEARAILRGRFVDHTIPGIPSGWRVYAAHVSTLDNQGTTVSSKHEVVTKVSQGTVTDAAGSRIGMTQGPGVAVQAALAIGIGSMGFLVLPPTESSGPGHQDRVDAAAAANGLERLVPRRGDTITLTKSNADVGVFRDIFVGPWFGTNRDLLPERLRALLDQTE